MSKSGNAYIAATQGSQFTLYAACKAKGIPLSKEQEEFQAQLEKRYPPVVGPDLDENEPEDHSMEDAEYEWKRDKEESQEQN